jgi:hypothetical protein
VDERHIEHSDDERLVRASLLAAYPPTRSTFSQRRGEQIIRAAALEELTRRRPSAGGRVAVSVAAAFTLLAGTASAASAALPGHPLYPLKRAIERAMVAMSDDGAAARLELRFAERRLDEASVVGTGSTVASSLADRFNEHIDAATDLAGPDVSDEIEHLRRARSAPDTASHSGDKDRSANGGASKDGAGGDDATGKTPERAPSATVGRSPEPAPTASPSPSATPSASASPSPSASPTAAPDDGPRLLPVDPGTLAPGDAVRRLLPVDPGTLAPGDAVRRLLPSNPPRTRRHRR